MLIQGTTGGGSGGGVPHGYVTLSSVDAAPGMYLSVKPNSTKERDPVVLSPLKNDYSKWLVAKADEGGLTLQNAASKMFLHVLGSKRGKGEQVYQWPNGGMGDDGTFGSAWVFAQIPTRPGQFTARSAKNGAYLHVRGSLKSANDPVCHWPWCEDHADGTNGSAWRIESY